MQLRIAGSTMTLAGLAGCASMTAVHPGAAALMPNDLAAGQDILAAGNGAWPDADWWRAFDDPQLDGLIEKAIAGNPRMAIAQSRVAAAQGLARVTRAALLPSVEGAAESDLTRYSQDFYIPPAINGHDLFTPLFSNSLGVTGNYSFDFWGRDRAALEASLDQVKVREYEAQSVRLTLEGAVLRSYAELAYTYEVQDHERAILTAEDQTLDLARRRLRAGIGTELEIQQASTAVATTQAELESVTDRLALLRHQLAALTGAGPGAGDSITRPALTVNQSQTLPSQIPAELIGRRPDVQAERWRVESASKQVAVARAAFYPNVNLKASFGLLGIGFGDLFTLKAIDSTVGPAITLPIFEGGKLRAGLDIRTSEYDMAVDAYNAAIVEALHEIADQISHLQSLQSLRERRAESLQYARRAHELAIVAFRAGLTDYNNVLSTEDALNRADTSIAQVGLEQITAYAALNQALGGGLLAASQHSEAPQYSDTTARR